MGYLSRDPYGMYADTSGAGPGPGLMGAATLVGCTVSNPDGERLGTIREFMIEMDNGQIAYAVLSMAGSDEIAAKLFAVPWRALILDTEQHRFTLATSLDTLADAPGFDPERWPSMADEIWARNVYRFYGTPYRPSGR